MIRFSLSMPDRGPRWAAAPSPLAAALARVALGMFVGGALLAPAGLREADAACGAPDMPEGLRTIGCDTMTKVDVDFLNDEIEPTAAFGVNAVEVRAGEPLEFSVYALTDDPRFYSNVSYDRKAIRCRAHGFRKPARLQYTEDSNNPRWVFTPRRERPEHNTGTIEVIYRCKRPGVSYTTYFFVTVLPPAN